MGCVYVATNTVTGRRYVGLTIRPLKRRIKGHWDRARQGSQTHFHRALRKHGRDAFSWEVVCEVDDRVTLAAVERQTIAQLRDGGERLYNITSGGDGALGFTPELRRRIAETQRGRAAPNKGVPHTEETKRKIGDALRGRPNWRKVVKGGTSWMKGRTPSAETRKKISDAKRARDAARRGC